MKTIKISWKIQIITSLLFGMFFGYFHYLLEKNYIVFIYSTISTFILFLLLWEIAKFIYRYTEKKYSWFTYPIKRIWTSLFLGILLNYLAVFLIDICLPFLLDPIFGVNSDQFSNQPPTSFATFFVDGIISLIASQSFLTVINLLDYFGKLQQQREKLIEQNIEKYFESMIENIHDVIQVIGKDGALLYCSSSIKSLTGYSVDETKQLPNGFALISEQDRGRIIEEFNKKIRTNFSSYSTRYKILTKYGEEKFVETKVINATDNEQLKGYITINSDITQRVNNEQIIQHQKSLYQLLTDISTFFLNNDLAFSIRQMLDKTGKFSEVDRAYVYLLNEEKNHWDCIYEWRSENAEKIKSNFYQSGIKVDDSLWMYEQIAKNKIINFENTDSIGDEAGDFKNICQADNTTSVLLIPIIRNETIYGFMGFDSVLKVKKWKQEDISMLQICAEILISAMMRNEAEKLVQQSLSVNKAIVDSTSEGILLTDLNDNILYYNQNFKNMWMLSDKMLSQRKKSIALEHAIKNVINADEIYQIISTSEEDINKSIRLVAYLKNKRILEGISQPQIIDGKVVGRVWSNRDITERVNAEKEEIEKGIAQAQFESLKNQVNPHFLFNSLNVLSSLVHIDADLSEKFIDQLARSYRYLLEQKDNELVVLKTEIDFVQSFTFLLKIRFEDKLQLNLNLSSENMQYYIAPLTLQLLIENAVKHNIVSAENPLKIDIYSEGNEYLIVKNNLQLREQQLPSTGVGLKNIRNRYALLTKKETEFYIDNDHYFAKIPLINHI